MEFFLVVGLTSVGAYLIGVKWIGLSSGGLRITSGTSRRLRAFAVTQIAASFVLLVGAGVLVTTLLSLQAVQTGFDMRHVLALNVPVMRWEKPGASLHIVHTPSSRRVW